MKPYIADFLAYLSLLYFICKLIHVLSATAFILLNKALIVVCGPRETILWKI